MSDPLRNPEPLVRRVYAYAAYRLGDGPEAEDVTSETFERALRYRWSYDPSKGPPAAWLVGIARRCADDALGRQGVEVLYAEHEGRAFEAGAGAGAGMAELADLRLDLREAVGRLGERDRELIALRYGADLKAKEIAAVLEMTTGAVMALHRALGRLREML